MAISSTVSKDSTSSGSYPFRSLQHWEEMKVLNDKYLPIKLRVLYDTFKLWTEREKRRMNSLGIVAVEFDIARRASINP